MVDYDDIGGRASNFKCVLGDYGTAGENHMGGTPVYAGPNTYDTNNKDLFSFGRLALELFLEQTGKSQYY